MSVSARLDRFQQRHRWAGFPIAVVYKYADDHGYFLAALIAYYGFVSLFPLLLLLSTSLGVLLQGDPDLQRRILDSTLSQFPVIGQQLGDPQGLRGSGPGLVLAVLGSVYGALGVAQATQHAMNVAWAVPMNRRPNPLVARLRSLVLIATAGIAVLGTTVLSALGVGPAPFGADIGLVTRLLATTAAVAVNIVVFTLAFRIATARRLGVRDILPGAVTAAAVWQVLQTFGAAYVGHVVKDASATNGVFALVLGLIAWLYLAAASLVLAVEVNVVRSKRLHPRALLSPFTDDVDLTRGDRRTYTDAATAQRTKEFESVDVSFEHDGQNATARRRSPPAEEPAPDGPASPPDPGER